MQTRRTKVSAAVLLLAGTLIWLTQQSPEASAVQPKESGPTPMSSLQARMIGTTKSAAKPATADDEEDEENEEDESAHASLVIVALRSTELGIRIFPKTVTLDPAQFWPLPDEAPFPEGPIADGLQELLLDEPTLSERDWLIDAEASGVLEVDPADDPWAAVLALEVERRRARQDWDDAYADAASTLPPGHMVAQRKLVGPPEVDAVIDLADALITAAPDAPTAEYGRLYLLNALQSAGGAAHLLEARTLALDMLRNTDDALVAGQAVSLLTKMPRTEPMPLDDLDALDTLVSSFPEAMADPQIMAYALDQALRHDDIARAESWVERLEHALAQNCDANSSDLQCITHQDSLIEVLGVLGVRDPTDSTSWQETVELASYLCANTYSPGSYAVSAAGRWDGTWDWDWDEPSAFTDCVEHEVDSGPMPTHDLVSASIRIIDKRGLEHPMR